MSRNVRNVQHLPRYGWTPVVLTPNDASSGLVDADSLRLVPDNVEIVRTGLVGPRDLHRAAALTRAASSRARRIGVALRRGWGAPSPPRGEPEVTASLDEAQRDRQASPDLALRIRRFPALPGRRRRMGALRHRGRSGHAAPDPVRHDLLHFTSCQFPSRSWRREAHYRPPVGRRAARPVAGQPAHRIGLWGASVAPPEAPIQDRALDRPLRRPTCVCHPVALADVSTAIPGCDRSDDPQRLRSERSPRDRGSAR